MDDKLRAVQRMQRYIDSHISEQITPAQLAEEALFSPWYARKIFEQYTGLTPARYIRRLKLSRSALRLRDEKCGVLDIALDMGFGSAEGYQRAFRNEFGINPRAYAEAPVPIPLFIPYLVKPKDSERNDTMENVKTVFVTEVNRPARKVIIKRGIKADEYMSYCEEVGCDVWGILASIRTLDGEPVCMWLPEHLRDPKANIYVQGAEVPTDFDGTVPEGFDVIDLPAGSFLMFRGEPFEEEQYVQAIQQVWQAEEKFDLTSAGYMRDDSNPRIQLEPIGTRGYIELVPVKKI
ncbi:helix-turn-helix domain-containing protein [Ruminococcus albus]|uniref:AraC-type DNA-binding protein n=1 Tax=Ruminococcus albus TaxID=1264 RepID=A0A1I1JTW3_RUMAL|nr:AraC family transcriptional regulator [Ruminococcus albus]SFC52014.1 AraC-type DNA-binding protein [Ruminococcus albus]